MNLEKRDGMIYCILKDAYLIETPEEKVRQEYINHLINNYGYKPEQMAQEVQVTTSHRGQGRASADIVVWKSEKDKIEGRNAFIVVECKAENIKIHSQDYYQGFNYATWAGASFFITTNQKETKYFNVDKKFLPQKLQEVIAIPSASEVENEKKIKELLNQTKAFTRDEFTKILFACHNIIRNNDKLSPEAAFDEISKILFMKIKYEREQKGNKVFTREQFIKDSEFHEKNIRPNLRNTNKDLPYMQFIFENTKEEFKEDQLFEDNEIIKIRQHSFEQILGKLESYNLSDTQDDIKGIAFEEFLGKTFRGELGQFFTPRTIVDFMTTILDPKEGEVICDPTCGSGGFLIKSFEYVREKIENDIQIVKDKFKKQLMTDNYDDLSEENQNEINKKVNEMFRILNKELETIEVNNTTSRLYNLSHNCIFGTDANSRMARTSKMNMIMHGDGHGGVHHHDGLLNVNGIFEERFDVILTNPPFGSRVDKGQKITNADKFVDKNLIRKYTNIYGDDYKQALNQINDNIGKPLLGLFETGSMTGLTEILFMERCLKLLKKGGRMGIVLPEGVLNTSNLQKVREYFEGKAKIVLICSIPQDVFIAAGATVKPSLVFLKRFTEEEEKEYGNAVEKAIKEIKKDYQTELYGLKEELANLLRDKTNKSRQREIRNRFKEIDREIEEKSKPLIKKYFDYEIPITKVDSAGITSTGAECENELIEVAEEFYKYNRTARLWEDVMLDITYELTEEGNIIRKVGEKEQELTW